MRMLASDHAPGAEPQRAAKKYDIILFTQSLALKKSCDVSYYYFFNQLIWPHQYFEVCGSFTLRIDRNLPTQQNVRT